MGHCIAKKEYEEGSRKDNSKSFCDRTVSGQEEREDETS